VRRARRRRKGTPRRDALADQVAETKVGEEEKAE